ncbi:hypothetical protein NDU88_005389 [Pleurodeles waltl]|uniref:Uncharacterized protein n=1 Tax=Pleurodeles waltl TaxID=8319 RepID=A0AAV7LTZ0_PLEWA|nr:hypothetical protein NDU88_005389 [Pleurodeles waltl]
MGRHRQSVASQGNTTEQYTTPMPLPQRQMQSGGPEDALGVPGTTGETSQAELLAAIQGSRVALEGKIETWRWRVFVVERAHRASVAPHRPGAPPRAIIARLLNYKDRDCVLRAGRMSERAVFENCKISIYPDYTNKVQTSRKGFMEVKAKLRAMNVRYMLLYSARLKVISGGKSHFFDRRRRFGDGWRSGTKLRLVGRRGPA